jgi:glycogen phosphorylase
LSKALAGRGLHLDPELFLDVHVKRIHEYKRQHLNLLHAITAYLRIKSGRTPAIPRTICFAGKAAPGYFMAKLIIRLVHEVARKVEQDANARPWLKLLFVPNFNVKNGELIYPAADLSQQISTAGMEASGTGNMKLSMNGALTIGTLDGANVELREAVGAENFFLFGLTAEEVAARKATGYRPRDFVERDAELAAAIELIASGHFSAGERDLFAPLIRGLLDHDPFLVLADYRAYVDQQGNVERAFAGDEWTKTSILNVARVGRFSSDRSIRDYASRVWRIEPVAIEGT